ncbi:CAP domain-containing protein [Aquimarina mytili]|uniref:CAP domain-containing protein n=1 Tax=Aquimarina mytili TaxID=874423 RepID=A0A936ZQ53_9FLAO|nr:CAP domain-containing protein [Aquimarina mytili]MBL0683372.1 CAP domain-containing protein [Aquimarina mytili]
MKTTLLRYLCAFALLCITFSCSNDDDAPFIPQGSTNPPVDTPSEVSITDEIFTLVNAHRLSNGLAALEKSTTADILAAEHSRYMIGQGRISHDNRDTKFATLRENENATRFGENVAAGQTSAQSVMTAWLNSDGHRENIEGDYTHIGIAAIKDQNGSYYYTQIFYR